jgi:hypothetical protein
MRKEDAIKILETNIYRELCRNWLKYSSLFLGPGIIIGLIAYFLPLPTITLPQSPMKVENIMPAIFTGTIAATSIIVGFFALSAYNFRQWLQRKIDEYFDEFPKIRRLHNEAVNKKVELEKLEKETEKKEMLEEIAKKKVEIEGTLRECDEWKELVELNRDAYAHQQEHLSTFLFTYLSVSFLLLYSGVTVFLATALASWIIAIFVYWTVISWGVISSGLDVFMMEFMTYTVHKERVREEARSPLQRLKQSLSRKKSLKLV